MTADADLYEATGSTQDMQTITASIDLYNVDLHSAQHTDRSYADHPIAARSAERWLRLRLSGTHPGVARIRFWVPNANKLPTGWTLKFGTASTYTTPKVGQASSVAVNPVPTTDPGKAAPNCGGPSSLADDSLPRFSDWVVLQAVVDPLTAGPGNALGFTGEGTPVPLELGFAWEESRE